MYIHNRREGPWLGTYILMSSEDCAQRLKVTALGFRVPGVAG